MRGFGANQAAFAIEGILDILAEKVGIDGYDIRERNILEPGDRFATGQLMTSSCGVRQTLEAVREVYKSSNKAGIACGIKNTGIGNGMEDVGRVAIEVLTGGRLEVLTGYTEMGQGLHTIYDRPHHQRARHRMRHDDRLPRHSSLYGGRSDRRPSALRGARRLLARRPCGAPVPRRVHLRFHDLAESNR
jgi:hypothetical protein